MAQPRNEDLAALGDFLDERWDPIGVYCEPFGNWPPGEYAVHAERILAALLSGADRSDVVRHLTQAREGMGLQDAPDRGRDVEVAGAILSWWALL